MLAEVRLVAGNLVMIGNGFGAELDGRIGLLAIAHRYVESKTAGALDQAAEPMNSGGISANSTSSTNSIHAAQRC